MNAAGRSRYTFAVTVALATFLRGDPAGEPVRPSPQAPPAARGWLGDLFGRRPPVVRPSPPAPAGDVGAALLALHNAERAKARLPPLATDARLTAAAQIQAADCARRGAIGHTGSDGSTVGQRITRQGYPWVAAGENAAWQGALPPNWPGADPRTAEWAMQGWMKSPGHRATILTGAYRDFGAAVAVGGDGARHYIACFGRRR